MVLVAAHPAATGWWRSSCRAARRMNAELVAARLCRRSGGGRRKGGPNGGAPPDLPGWDPVALPTWTWACTRVKERTAGQVGGLRRLAPSALRAPALDLVCRLVSPVRLAGLVSAAHLTTGRPLRGVRAGCHRVPRLVGSRFPRCVIPRPKEQRMGRRAWLTSADPWVRYARLRVRPAAVNFDGVPWTPERHTL